MPNWSVAVLPGLVAALLTGCPSAAQQPSGLPVDSSGTAPSVTVRATCEAMVPAYCRGKYAFHIAATGLWRVGPNPDGRQITDRLPEAERRALQELAGRVLQGVANQPGDCRTRPAIPGVGEEVTVAGATSTVTLRGTVGKVDALCTPGDAAADAALFVLADKLMRRYYPEPF